VKKRILRKKKRKKQDRWSLCWDPKKKKRKKEDRWSLYWDPKQKKKKDRWNGIAIVLEILRKRKKKTK